MVRKSKNQPMRPATLIYCEGETEKNYFGMLKAKYSRKNVHILLKDLGSNGDKMVDNILRACEREKRRNPRLAVYLCFDRDNLSTDSVAHQIKTAMDKKIGIIYSNRSIEVWLLAHFEKLEAHEYTQDALYQRLEQYLKLPDHYVNSKAADFMDKLTDHIQFAANNTKDFPQFNNVPSVLNQNPYTNFAESIRTIFQTEKL